MATFIIRPFKEHGSQGVPIDSAYFAIEENNGAKSVEYWGKTGIAEGVSFPMSQNVMTRNEIVAELGANFVSEWSRDLPVLVGPVIECFGPGAAPNYWYWRSGGPPGTATPSAGVDWASSAFNVDSLKLFDSITPETYFKVPLSLSGAVWPTVSNDERTAAICSAFSVRVPNWTPGVDPTPETVYVDATATTTARLTKYKHDVSGGYFGSGTLPNGVSVGTTCLVVYARHSTSSAFYDSPCNATYVADLRGMANAVEVRYYRNNGTWEVVPTLETRRMCVQTLFPSFKTLNN